MACLYYDKSGRDLDNIFLVTNSMVGQLGFVDLQFVDIGNKYTDETTLNYPIGFVAANGLDIGYLRGDHLAVPGWAAHDLSGEFYYSESWSPGGEGYSAGYGCNGTRGNWTFIPRATEFLPHHSYTVVVQQLLYTYSGDSSGCAYGIHGDEREYFLSCNSSHGASGGRCGNRHGQYGWDKPCHIWELELPFTNTESYSWQVEYSQCWDGSVFWEMRAKIVNKTNQKESDWWYSDQWRNNDVHRYGSPPQPSE